MNITKEIILPVLLLILVVLAVVSVLTGFYMMDMSSTCGQDGGTFTVEGGTAFCRY
jgi:hypothetical protein